MQILPDNPKDYELEINEFWQKNNCFESTHSKDSAYYTILMPPPNVTSKLHMGHGAGYTLQDWLIRHNRMLGKNVCWIPGLDHAGIATQMMVEKNLAKQNITKHQLGREKFIQKVKDWKNQHGGTILEQIKSMGFSCHWSKLAYTMDEKRSKAVIHAFVQLFNEGLIYRGKRLVNWDPTLQTALGNDELENKTINGFLYKIRYPLVNEDNKKNHYKFSPTNPGSFEGITIATTRPETLLADVAVAVHPDDKRYQKYINKKLILPFVQRKIPIIADSYVRQDFGTGAVKITPAHDINDYEIAGRHQDKNLEYIDIFDDRAHVKDTNTEYDGLERFACRKKLINDLQKIGYYIKKENYSFIAAHSERSKTLIEPKLCKQWFVDTKSLAEPAIKAAESQQIKFYPSHYKKTWLYWLQNIQDWCISRQLWWGHRIPVWTCQNPQCKKQFASTESSPICPHCQSTNPVQDPDVLDTWFSSWLWPLSTLGWPDNKDDLKVFYPSQVIVTGAEIIFLWVARMIMAGYKFQGSIAFKEVFFNAIVCDKKGRKFSKTLGNGIDPLEIIDQYGADALRYTAAHISPIGGRIKMAKDDFKLGRNFVHKLKNAAKFLLAYLDDHKNQIQSIDSYCKDQDLKIWHLALIHHIKHTSKKIDIAIQSYKTHEASRLIYNLVWNIYCDRAIESSKHDLNSSNTKTKLITLSVMLYALEGCIRICHPLIPFLTEKIFQILPTHPDIKRNKSLCQSSFPSLWRINDYQNFQKLWDTQHEIIQSIRRLKQQISQISDNNDHQDSLAAYISFDQRFTLVFTTNYKKDNKDINNNELDKNSNSISQTRLDEFNLMIKTLCNISKVHCQISSEDLDNRLSKDNDLNQSNLSSQCQSKNSSTSHSLNTSNSLTINHHNTIIDITSESVLIKLIISDSIDRQKLKNSLVKETKIVTQSIINCQKKLKNQAFLDNAPTELITNTKDYLKRLKLRIKALNHNLNIK